MVLNRHGIGTRVGLCEHGNEPSVFGHVEILLYRPVAINSFKYNPVPYFIMLVG
jgi:hypothetical protein